MLLQYIIVFFIFGIFCWFFTFLGFFVRFVCMCARTCVCVYKLLFSRDVVGTCKNYYDFKNSFQDHFHFDSDDEEMCNANKRPSTSIHFHKFTHACLEDLRFEDWLQEVEGDPYLV